MHDISFNPDDCGRFERRCGTEPLCPLLQTTQSKKVAFAHHRKSRFFAGKGYNHKLHLAALDVIESVRRFSLGEYNLIFAQIQNALAKRNTCKGLFEMIGITMSEIAIVEPFTN